MLFRKTIFALALTGAVLPAAFANSGVTWVGGERGFEFHAQKSTKSRAEVQKELEAFRQNPVTADGGSLTGRDAGYIPRSTAMLSRAASWSTQTALRTTLRNPPVWL